MIIAMGKITNMIKNFKSGQTFGNVKSFFNGEKTTRTFRSNASNFSYVQPDSIRIIFTSGSALKFNGGTKLYNLWVKLLRSQGYQAYLATVDGQYDQWLNNHQPVIDYDTVNDFKRQGLDIRLVTAWLDIPRFDSILGDGQFFYFDAELRWTLQFKKNLERFLKNGQIAGIGTHSRYIQSWYMAELGIKPILINEWSDQTIFYQSPEIRVKNRIGYMIECAEDEEIVRFLQKKCLCSQIPVEIVRLQGAQETDLAQEMRQVDIFIGLNQGKHPLWGEGCPRTQQEALHSGCVLVAFDVLGNREYLYDGWTGLLVQPGDFEGLWNAIEFLLKHEDQKEKLRENGMALVGALFGEEGKIKLVKKFLRFDGMTKQDLTSIFPSPFWLGEHEIPFLAKQAANAKKTIVELGCAYGGSTTIFLLNKLPSAHVYSIDPFVPDSIGSFRASERDCRFSVKTALHNAKKSDLINDWTLICDYSDNVFQTWDKKIDLLFIDGSHRYEDVKQDFEQWSRHLSREGTILVHDSCKDNLQEDPLDKVFSWGWAGPTKLVNEISCQSDFKISERVYSISSIKKRE
jgi:hypothetical protein